MTDVPIPPTMDPPQTRADRGRPFGWPILFAPLVFIAHFLEEGRGFVSWFNAHVPNGITESLFWTVNVNALAITVGVVVLAWLVPSGFSPLAVVAWFSFLMAANALLHIVGAIVDRAYMPGLVTAILLYLPFYTWVMRETVRSRRWTPAAIVSIAILGALPMLAHGYLIIFRQSRLF
jgi:hypothetical protein